MNELIIGAHSSINSGVDGGDVKMEMIDDKAGGLADLMCIEDKTGSSNLDQDWQLQGALNKRRYQDMELANTSNAAPEKRSRSTRGVKLEEATKDSDALHRVLKYVSTTLARLHSWKHDILKHVPISKMNPDHQWLDKDLDYFFPRSLIYLNKYYIN
ncbi:hypothetical protein PCANC_10355 [Puccinia coronata f. sp. avenae]|uniref:Uncharacterized protein n=1 Tax=Puccinia coronata f. sp. avenae TaxID=200324 RepID=A0A2N5VNY5_9BASI|nr:hypothetical protein PCANC_10355 [Puccinia coronata f. sp. avenae]PLW51698.1 hypothetical protein PCASD_00460 [Puccinia coronata f. sp. avenae]